MYTILGWFSIILHVNSENNSMRVLSKSWKNVQTGFQTYSSCSDLTQQSQKSTKGSDETDRRHCRKSE